MKLFSKRKTKWDRVFLEGYHQGLHAAYCKSAVCLARYETCPNVKAHYEQEEQRKALREMRKLEVELGMLDGEQ